MEGLLRLSRFRYYAMEAMNRISLLVVAMAVGAGAVCGQTLQQSGAVNGYCCVERHDSSVATDSGEGSFVGDGRFVYRGKCFELLSNHWMPCSQPSPKSHFLRNTAILMIAGQTADTATTIHLNGRELNPMGRYTLAVDWTATGALLGVEWILRNNPRARRFLGCVNIGVGVEHGFAGVHNAMQ